MNYDCQIKNRIKRTEGQLRGILPSVAPAPYTRPHPKVFVAGSGSPQTIDSAADTASCRPTSPPLPRRGRYRSATVVSRHSTGAASRRGRTNAWCAGSRSARPRRTRWIPHPCVGSRYLEELLRRDGSAEGGRQRYIRLAGQLGGCSYSARWTACADSSSSNGRCCWASISRWSTTTRRCRRKR